MIAPGWMPSRPRPLGAVRRAWHCGGHLRRRPRRTAPPPAGADRLDSRLDGFDGGRTELPTAILQRSSARRGDGWIDGYARHWLATRTAWLRPRIVPLLVAVAGMFGVMSAERYLSALARGETANQMDVAERPLCPSPAPRP